MTEQHRKKQQQEWIRQHTLTWTQTKQLIESKLERARQMSEAVQKREALAKSR